MTKIRRHLAVILFAASLVQTPLAIAQVPPHNPGTICFTPKFWCWANPSGIPNQPCSCPTPYGWVRGVLG